MKKGDLRIVRGKIIEKFVGIEQLIAAIICWRYLKRENLDFMLNIFGNDQATFSFKRNIILHIYKLNDTEFANKLNRLNKIRNLFIHSPRTIESDESEDFYFRNVDSDFPANLQLDPKALCKEFDEKYAYVYSTLAEILKIEGFVPKIDYTDPRIAQ